MAEQVFCTSCGAEVNQPQSAINRAIRQGKPLYCDRICAGMARRVSSSQKKRQKRLYDARRRVEKAAEISAQKAAYYQRTCGDPGKEHERRRANRDRHAEYCRQPAYTAYKAAYDQERRAKEYGPYADSYLLLLDLEREIRSRATWVERAKARGYYTRSAQQRRRELCLAVTGN